MKSILLVNSPLFDDTVKVHGDEVLPPIGLGYLATALKNHGHDVELLDAVCECVGPRSVSHLISERLPEFVCINIFSTNLEIVKSIVCSEYGRTITFVIGGGASRALYSEIITWNTSNEITVVIGDGEKIILDIVSGNVSEKPIANNDNKVAYVVDKKSSYYVHDISNSQIDHTFFKGEPYKNKFGLLEACISSSRGCWHNCSYCAAASRAPVGTVRRRTDDSLRQEIKDLVGNFGIQSVRILDDLFLGTQASIDRAHRVFANTNVGWRAMAHVAAFRHINDKVLERLRISGCYELFLGIESGSPKILKDMHRYYSIHEVKECVQKILCAGINVKGYFIYGFPNETIEDCDKTYNLAIALHRMALTSKAAFRNSVFEFRPYHGTHIYDILLKEYGNVAPIAHDDYLSRLIGRDGFNFSGSTYSFCTKDQIHHYINLTSKLNFERHHL